MMMDTIVQGQNSLGEFFLLPLDKDIYSTEAIMKTCYAFTDDYFIHVIKTKPESVNVCFYNKNESDDASNIKTVVGRFLHLLHENQLRQIILQETQTLHEEIVRKAFSPVSVFVETQPNNAPDHILTSVV
jgi:His-Xaa-Ser system protein HxsD